MTFPVRILILAAAVLVALTAVPAAAAPGVLDPLFGTDGWVTAFPLGSQGQAVAVDQHGRIVVAGTTLDRHVDVAVARFLPDGRPDPGFGGGDGRVRVNMGADEYGLDLALTDGGGIAIAGRRLTARADRAIVIRLKPDGRPDHGFGGGDGAVAVDLNARYQGANAIAFALNGSILAAGFTSNGFGGRLALFRLTEAGALDDGFSHDGKAVTDISEGSEQVNDLLVLSGGKILVAGSGDVGLTPRFLIARYTSNGGLDETFGRKPGYTFLDLGDGAEAADALAQQPNGKLVLTGSASDGANWGLARVGFNGAPDPAFGGDGVRMVSFAKAGGESAAALAIQTNGRIVVAGRTKGTKTDLAVARFRPGGRTDRGFGVDGLALVDGFGSIDLARGVALQANGKIVATGETWRSGRPRFLVSRFLAS